MEEKQKISKNPAVEKFSKRVLNKALFYALLAFLFISATVWGLSFWVEQRLLAETQADVQQNINLYGASLVQTLNRQLSFINGLTTYLETEIDHADIIYEDETLDMVAGIYEDSHGVLNIALAPDGIMKFVYPYEPNKAVLGYEPAKDERPNVRDDVRRAIETREVILSLPIELIQGGQGVIARQAVFYDDEEYWGLASVVIDLPFLLDEAGLSNSTTNLSLALKDQSGAVFFGSEAVFAQSPVLYEIPLAEGSWVLAGMPKDGWQSSYSDTLKNYRALGGSIALLIGSLVYLIYYRQGQLELLVEDRTGELLQANLQLQEDILRRKQAEDELRESELKANALLNAIPDHIFQLNRDGIFLDFKSNAETLYVPLDKIIGRNLKDIFPESVTEIMLAQIDKTLSIGELVIFEYPLEYEDDRYSEYEARMVQSGEDEVVAIVRNITQRKQKDLEIQRLNQALEQRVVERTAQLNATVQELESFSYSVSHDLRAPLRAINGYSEILTNEYHDLLDEEGRGFLERIKSSSAKMDELINGLLMLSRLGRQSFSLTSFSVKELAQSLFDEFGAEGKQRDIEFQALDCPDIYADKALIKLALSNLITNAIKFSKHEHQALIQFGAKKENGKCVYYLQDNGIGFNMDYVDKIFSPFQRLHSGSEFEGTGIGLAITKRAIQRHEGRIWVESEPGEGTTFFFTIGTNLEKE